MRERHILRYVCCAVTLLFILYMVTLDDDIGDQRTQCIVDSIIYPSSFTSVLGWIPCNCFTEFCTQMCYCVNLFQGEYRILNKDYEENCTFQSNIIPYKLNFTNLIDMYYNKSFDCWYDQVKDLYYLDGNTFKNNLRATVIGVYSIIMAFILVVECFTSGMIRIGAVPVDSNQEEDETLPSYEEDVPPCYEEHEA